MKLLIDTGVWFRFYHGLPLSKRLKSLMEQSESELYLCPLSVFEILFKWQRHRLPPVVQSPHLWLVDALAGYQIINPTVNDAIIAGLWQWDNSDPMDRLITAVAYNNDLVLIHTDTRLKNLTGFPQMYFPALQA